MKVYKIRHKKTGFYFSGFHYRSANGGLPQKNKQGSPFYSTGSLVRTIKKMAEFDCELDDWEVISFKLTELSKKNLMDLLPDEIKIKNLLNLRNNG